MRIEDVVRNRDRDNLSPLKRRVLEYLEARPEEVFPNSDPALVKAVGGQLSSTNWTLWWLESKGFIAKAGVGRVYFGSHEAVAELKKQTDTNNGRRNKR
jgi:hypothetical protein